MDTALLAYPQNGFANIDRLPTVEEVLRYVWTPRAAADPENVCAACGHEMEQFKPGRLDCVFCGVRIDLGE